MTASDAPARQRSSIWHDVLEQIAAGLPALTPAAAREPIAAAVKQALDAMVRLEGSGLEDPDHLGLLEAVADGVRRLRELLEGDGAGAASAMAARVRAVQSSLQDCRSVTLDAIVAVQAQLLRAPSRNTPPAAGFRASVGSPRLHRIERERLTVPIDLPGRREDEAKDEDRRLAAVVESLRSGDLFALAAIEAAPELDSKAIEDVAPVEEAVAEPGPGARAHLRRIARDCLEDIGSLGLLRRVRGSARWHPGIASFERRLLENLDALVALGQPVAARSVDVLAAAQRYAAEAVVADPMRAFARSFVLCCVEGEDTVRAAALALRSSHRSTDDVQRDAFALAPNPAVGAAMLRMCFDDDAPLACLALDVLRARGEASVGVAASLVAHPDSNVRTSVARCLSTVPERTAAVTLLERMVAGDADREVIAAAAESLLALDSPLGLSLVRRELADASAALRPNVRRTLVRLLALAGDESDVGLFAKALAENPADAEAVGWSGASELLELLVGLFESDHARRSGAREPLALAIRRIAGPAPWESTEAEDHGVASMDWRSMVAARRGRLTPGQKHRFGRPFTATSSLDELERDGVTGAEREACVLELLMLSGGAARVDPHTWVAAQVASLGQARARFAHADAARDLHRPGEWLAQRLGRRSDAWAKLAREGEAPTR